MARFWMMMLVLSLILKPVPLAPELAPTPSSEVLLPRSRVPQSETLPSIWTTFGSSPAMAASRSAHDVTVTGVAEPPPVVPAPKPIGPPAVPFVCLLTVTVGNAAAEAKNAVRTAATDVDDFIVIGSVKELNDCRQGSGKRMEVV